MPVEFDPTSALIVVDVQNDFADREGSLYVRGAEAIFPAIDGLLARAHAAGAVVVYTKDWHPARTPHFETSGGTWPHHCVAGTWGAQLHPRLRRVSPALFIHKGQGEEDGYSGFTVIDSRTRATHETGLADWLMRMHVRRVVVCGLATDYCVKHTVLDARRFRFDTVVVEDAVRPVELNPGDGERAWVEMREAGARMERELDSRATWEEAEEAEPHSATFEQWVH